MGLRWSIDSIDNYKEKCWVETDDGQYTLHFVTDGLIWSLFFVDIGRITEDNWREVYARIHMYEKVDGAYLYEVTDDGMQDRYITPQDVYDHIGLSVNVADNKAKFKKKIWGVLEDSAKRELKSWEREQENAPEGV